MPYRCSTCASSRDQALHSGDLCRQFAPRHRVRLVTSACAGPPHLLQHSCRANPVAFFSIWVACDGLKDSFCVRKSSETTPFIIHTFNFGHAFRFYSPCVCLGFALCLSRAAACVPSPLGVCLSLVCGLACSWRAGHVCAFPFALLASLTSPLALSVPIQRRHARPLSSMI